MPRLPLLLFLMLSMSINAEAKELSIGTKALIGIGVVIGIGLATGTCAHYYSKTRKNDEETLIKPDQTAQNITGKIEVHSNKELNSSGQIPTIKRLSKPVTTPKNTLAKRINTPKPDLLSISAQTDSSPTITKENNRPSRQRRPRGNSERKHYENLQENLNALSSKRLQACQLIKKDQVEISRLKNARKRSANQESLAKINQRLARLEEKITLFDALMSEQNEWQPEYQKTLLNPTNPDAFNAKELNDIALQQKDEFNQLLTGHF